ncbi:MAG: hypothetical protein KME15_22200 [Drouetiella hepatica Uher 2000/2452]|jgi:SepF-like predicted cell division protein (DUF552 family)|uniref:Uncharacterized protein n=1 Tax=Drouetiella hepatica Uher 2000/2452 TaxID=904376 RepID=A0A951QGG2_9CYAN|nr:hypothetical protein [Drouetiella hepatica Uher 2000/2452]
MLLKDLSPAEKSKIALGAIVGEVLGKSTSDIGAQFGISAKAVTTLRKQALDAIRQSFYGVQTQAPSTGLSDEEVSARLEKLLGNEGGSLISPPAPSKAEKVNEDESEDEEPISIDEIVSAIQEYNNVAGSKKKIYISRAVVAEVSPHSTKELESYFSEHKAEIDAHNEKHELKRNTNRGLKGENWISWLDL